MRAALVIGALVAVAFVVWLVRRPKPVCKLTLREGEGVGLEFVITAREATIGSEEGQTVVVSHPRVSRHHAVLTLEADQAILRDRSKQGTRVNGELIDQATLRSGDLISLADSIDLIFTRLG